MPATSPSRSRKHCPYTVLATRRVAGECAASFGQAETIRTSEMDRGASGKFDGATPIRRQTWRDTPCTTQFSFRHPDAGGGSAAKEVQSRTASPSKTPRGDATGYSLNMQSPPSRSRRRAPTSNGGVAESEDASDWKSPDPRQSCGFESRRRHHAGVVQ